MGFKIVYIALNSCQCVYAKSRVINFELFGDGIKVTIRLYKSCLIFVFCELCIVDDDCRINFLGLVVLTRCAFIQCMHVSVFMVDDDDE